MEPTTLSPIERIFGTGGWIAAKHPHYQPRAGQRQLAEAVHRAILENSVLVAEAPTGTGKTLGALAPALYEAEQSGRTIVYATASIALQEQLLHKDLPTLTAALPWKFSTAIAKGRSNYLCLDAWAEWSRQPSLFTAGDVAKRLRVWQEQTETGDRAELSPSPPLSVWRELSVTPDECQGHRCAHRRDCYAEKAREKAKGSTVIVTNHHLLSIDLLAGMGVVLPEASIIIVDEAHAFERILRDTAEARVTLDAMLGLPKWVDTYLEDFSLEARRSVIAIQQWIQSELPPHGRLRERVYLDPVEREDLLFAERALQAVTKAALAVIEQADGKDYRKHRRAFLTASRLMIILRALRTADPNMVVHMRYEPGGNAPVFYAQPLPVDHLVQPLFDTGATVVFMSATMAVGDNCRVFRRALGVPPTAREIIVPSPFDASRTMLYAPATIADPRTDKQGFLLDAAEQVRWFVETLQGRSLVLCTSYEDVAAMERALQELPYPLLVQKTESGLSREQLAKSFRADRSSVLIATESFWTGLDVPGDALLGLVILRLPFKPPTPLDQKRERRFGPREAFRNYVLPEAVTLYRQGTGRLIRSEQDYGVFMVLDPRIRTNGSAYGHLFRATHGSIRRTTRRADVASFLQTMTARG